MLLVSLAACRSDDSKGSETGAPTIATYHSSRDVGGDSAILAGHIEIVNNCVTVRQENGVLAVPVFPDTELKAGSGSTLFEYRGIRYATGSEFKATGGDVPGQSVPKACQVGETWTIATSASTS